MNRRSLLAGFGAALLIPKKAKAQPPSSDVGIRYVAESGDDGNDGLSWETAYRTLQKAADVLGSQGQGTIRFGRGIFDPVVISERINLVGVGAGTSQWGSAVKIPDNTQTHAVTGAEQGDAHHWTRLANFSILGNKQNGAVGDGIHVPWQTGEGFKVEQVSVVDCAGHGMNVEGGTVPLYVEDFHAFNNDGAGLRVKRPSGGAIRTSLITLLSGDDNGTALLEIEDNSSGPVVVTGVKSEANTLGRQQNAVRIINGDFGLFEFRGIAHYGNAPSNAAILAEGASQNTRITWSNVRVGTNVNWVYENTARGLQLPTNSTGDLNSRGSEVGAWSP